MQLADKLDRVLMVGHLLPYQPAIHRIRQLIEEGRIGAFGDAGMLVTHDDEVARRARELRNHGQTSRSQHRMVGNNSRMNRFQGAVLRQRLSLLTEWNNQRAAIAEQYARRLAGLPGVTRPATAPGNTRIKKPAGKRAEKLNKIYPIAIELQLGCQVITKPRYPFAATSSHFSL